MQLVERVHVLGGGVRHESGCIELLLDTAEALQRENKQLLSSLLKDTMKRKQPQFNEEYHGYRSFSQLLEDAAERKLIRISRDPRSGTYVIDEILEEGS